MEAAPSFNTEIEAIWLASILFNEDSTPSTIIKGIPKPRIFNDEESLPGSPPSCLAITPGSCPPNILVTLAIGAVVNFSFFTFEIEPVNIPFFCVP